MSIQAIVVCPECEYEFPTEAPLVGEVFPCLDCGLNLKVVGVDAGHERAAVELTESDADDWGQ